MLVDFNTLPEESKVWVYQANRSFTEEEIAEITDKLTIFVENWAAHGTGLQAGFEIRYKRFIILAVNQSEQAATGCSIQNQYKVDLMDKMNVSYKQGDFIAYKSLIDFKKMAKDRAVTGKTIVFNNLVTNLGELNEAWEIPASESWHNRFF